jgi:hypothetical protein
MVSAISDNAGLLKVQMGKYHEVMESLNLFISTLYLTFQYLNVSGFIHQCCQRRARPGASQSLRKYLILSFLSLVIPMYSWNFVLLNCTSPVRLTFHIVIILATLARLQNHFEVSRHRRCQCAPHHDLIESSAERWSCSRRTICRPISTLESSFNIKRFLLHSLL